MYPPANHPVSGSPLSATSLPPPATPDRYQRLAVGGWEHIKPPRSARSTDPTQGKHPPILDTLYSILSLQIRPSGLRCGLSGAGAGAGKIQILNLYPNLSTRTRPPTAETRDLKMYAPNQSSGLRFPFEC